MKRYIFTLLVSMTILFGNTTNLIDYFKNNKDAMLFIDPSNGKILKANSSASKFYGYTIDTRQAGRF